MGLPDGVALILTRELRGVALIMLTPPERKSPQYRRKNVVGPACFFSRSQEALGLSSCRTIWIVLLIRIAQKTPGAAYISLYMRSTSITSRSGRGMCSAICPSVLRGTLKSSLMYNKCTGNNIDFT